MAKKLKRGRWTAADVKELRRLYGSHSIKDVANVLGRPPDTVKKKASRLGLVKTRRYRERVLHHTLRD